MRDWLCHLVVRDVDAEDEGDVRGAQREAQVHQDPAALREAPVHTWRWIQILGSLCSEASGLEVGRWGSGLGPEAWGLGLRT